MLKFVLLLSCVLQSRAEKRALKPIDAYSLDCKCNHSCIVMYSFILALHRWVRSPEVHAFFRICSYNL